MAESNYSNVFLKSVRKSVGLRLTILFGSFFILLLFVSLISSIINSLPIGSERSHLLISSTLQCLFAFCIPAVLLSKYSSHDWTGWLFLTKKPSYRSICGIILIYFISLPAMEWLIEWNANLHFPKSLSSIETLFREWETSSEETTKILLGAQGWIAILTGIIVIGIITGLSEELFFRGGLQGIFVRSNMGKDFGVWAAAFIFSAMHFQFFGFLPRLLMGVFFGYLLVWTRSIWVPVFAHVVNNSAVVITSAFPENTFKSIKEIFDINILSGNTMIIVGSVICTFLFLKVCRKIFFKPVKTSSPWQKSQCPPISGN